MRRLIITTASLLLFISVYSQFDSSAREFRTNANGLMYSANDMTTLRFIVDSLNLRFKTCDLSKKFYSQPQTNIIALSFRSEDNDLKKIIADLNTGISYKDLQVKYASFLSSADSSKIVIKSDKDYYLSGTPATGYNSIALSDGKKLNSKWIKNTWTYTYYPKQTYSNTYSLHCYFFPEDFKSNPIPDNYAKLIQYVDCMIDTSAYIYLTEKSDWDGFSNHNKLYAEVNDYINKAMKLKKHGKNDWEYSTVTGTKLLYAKESLKDDRDFISLVQSVADECERTKQSREELEDLIGTFISKEKALSLKRSRRVVGMCSMDQSPREHARKIAILAAEAHSWDIFLRAHLDIMNDRFERMSDGSYAYGGRKTYLKELEELNLNIVDLMLGLTLRADNVASNHYYGTIWRMGWALTESKEKKVFEEKAIAMMKDPSLDKFNRGLLFLLYNTYLNYLDPKEGNEKMALLKEQINTFPDFIRASIKSLKDPKNDSGK